VSTRVIPVEPFDYVVFGGTGDLARRKLLPALYCRWVAGQIPEGSRIVGASYQPLSGAAYRAWVAESLQQALPEADLAVAELGPFLALCSHVQVDVRGQDGWAALGQALLGREGLVRVFYLALAPGLVGAFCAAVAREGLVTPRTRVVVEKPIGRSLESAVALSEAVGQVFGEGQTYRIDHYLGKETVQNLMALRFANSLFEPVWNAAHVDHVQITVAETLGVGERGPYYDSAGALRDMVQNHLLQLLCLVALEPPDSYRPDSLRDEKLKVLKALRPIEGEDVARLTVRGQYTGLRAGPVNVPSYAEDVGLARSTTETFVALKAEVANWRWAGVPFYLRTGKRLPVRTSEIVVNFRPVPHSIFARGSGALQNNRLVIRLQPDEGVKLWVMIKDPGPGGMRLRQVPLDMSFSEAFGVRNPDAYERLLMDVVRGDPTLFMRRDEVEAAWRWVDPIAAAWEQEGTSPHPYTAGTWGPSRAVALLSADGRTWHEETV
jgi:glucose-6-phosphate 1-dehydrogenase